MQTHKEERYKYLEWQPPASSMPLHRSLPDWARDDPDLNSSLERETKSSGGSVGDDEAKSIVDVSSDDEEDGSGASASTAKSNHSLASKTTEKQENKVTHVGGSPRSAVTADVSLDDEVSTAARAEEKRVESKQDPNGNELVSPRCWKVLLSILICILFALAGTYTGIRIVDKKQAQQHQQQPEQQPSTEQQDASPQHQDTRQEQIKSELVRLMASDPDGAAEYNTLIGTNTSSPEYAAFDWLIHSDALQLNLEQSGIERISQRYSLAVLYYSTHMNGTTNNWLDSKSECSWKGVICGANPKDILNPKTPNVQSNKNKLRSLQNVVSQSSQLVTELHLTNSSLYGDIPLELKLLQESLELLDLSHNHLRNLPPNLIGVMSKLHSLYLNDNIQLEGVVKLPSGVKFIEVNLAHTQLSYEGGVPCAASYDHERIAWLTVDSNVTLSNDCDILLGGTNLTSNETFINPVTDLNMTDPSSQDNNTDLSTSLVEKNMTETVQQSPSQGSQPTQPSSTLKILHNQKIWGTKDGDSFGALVAQSSDASRVVVTRMDQMKARVLEFYLDTWVVVGTDIQVDSPIIALDLSFDGSIVAITSSGQVQTFKLVGSMWEPFGGAINIDGNASMSMSDDGNRLAITRKTNNRNSVQLYQISSTTDWVKVGEAPVARHNSSSLIPVSLQQNILAVGNSIFEILPQAGGSTVSFGPLGNIQANNVDGVCLSGDGSSMAVNLGNDQIQLFARMRAGAWVQVGPILEGTSMQLSNDGTWMILGIQNSAKLMRFSRTRGDWITMLDNLYGDLPDDNFASSVSLAVTSDVVVVAAGAPGNDVDSRGYLQLITLGL